MIISLWKVFVKAGQRGWASFIPIYNAYVMLKISEKPGWWLVLFLIPVINLVFLVLTMHTLSENFGKKGGFAFGLSFLSIIFFPILAFGDAQYMGSYSDRALISTPIVNTGKFAVGFTGGILGGILGGVLFGIGTIIAMFLGCGMMAKSPTAELIVSTIIAGVMGFVMAAMTTEDGKDEPRGGCFIPMLYALGGFMYVKASQMLLISIPSASPIETRLAFANWNIETLMVSTGGFLLFSAILGGVLGMIRGSIAGVDWGKRG